MTDEGATYPWDNWNDDYEAYQRREGLPVHTGLAVDDVRELEVAEWDRTGGLGAFVNLMGMEGTCDIQILEIPGGVELNPQRHLHDALVYVIEGNGFTTLTGQDDRTFEWGTHSVFLLPTNTEYVHANGDPDASARLMVVTPLPLLYSLLKDDDLIWEPGEQGATVPDSFYSATTELERDEANPMVYWRSNFIPDVTSFDQLESFSERGGGGRTVAFPFEDSAMWAHISEFEVGKYKKAHRHICGSNVLVLSGEGYTLMWEEDDEEYRRIDWSPYSLFVPPTLWYHQQFNTSEDDARYMAFHSPLLGTGIYANEWNSAMMALNRRNQIEYHEEAAEIRELFRAELEGTGIEHRMDEALYRPESGQATFE